MSTTTTLTSNLVKSYLPSETLIARGKTFNMNETTQTGTYQITNSAETPVIGLPKGAYGYGNFTVFGGQNFMVQLYYPHRLTGGYAYYERMVYTTAGVTTLGDWYGFAGVKID